MGLYSQWCFALSVRGSTLDVKFWRQNLASKVGTHILERVNVSETISADKRCRPNVVLMLARCLWRRPNIKATLVQHLVFAGNWSKMTAKVCVRWPQAFYTYCDQAVTNVDQSLESRLCVFDTLMSGTNDTLATRGWDNNCSINRIKFNVT